MSLLALVSCKDNKNQESKTKMDTVEESADVKEEHHNDEASNVYENAWIKEIVMNNGAKWEANAETNEGVQKMQNSIKTQTTSTLYEYHKLAEQLNEDKNYVIKNCTMKGASHDNLHIWLLPLMAKIEALSESKTIEDAVKIKHSINENISAYKNYFQ
tara:strand:+ start:2924 stop:3397 length:474 start_codon:yes stop_codon:yes gene_type:complete